MDKNQSVEIEWEMSIGFPGAKNYGTTEIRMEDVLGMSEDEIDDYIGEQIWEDATQYVDVYPLSSSKKSIEQLKKLIKKGE